MAGLEHGHAAGFLARYSSSRDVELVGISESDRKVAAGYVRNSRLDQAMIYPALEAMLEEAKPQAVVVFTSTAGHPAAVAACASRKIPVMMEKPLAVGVEQARAIERAAAEGGIPVLVNGTQAIIQASWNWPFDSKDMEVHGRTGQALTVGQGGFRVRLPGKSEEIRQAPPLSPPGDDFLHYFAAVVRGEMRPSGLSSLKNNLIVTEILDAARRSAATGRRVRLT